MSEQNKESAQLKIQRVFSYIRELAKLQTPPVSQISSYDWKVRFSELPSYPTICTFQISDDSDNDFDGIVLRIKRPTKTLCPAPPTILTEWIEKNWDVLDKEASHIESRNKKDSQGLTVTESFEEDPERPRTFEIWIKKRQAWQEAERPVQKAANIFSDFFELQGQLQRESEKFQLYLGDGNLSWESAIEKVNHPILLKKVEMEFDPSVPEFIIRETDDSPELYTSLLRYHELDSNALLSVKTKLEEIDPHPLANGKTEDFFNFFIRIFFQNGQFYPACEKRIHAYPSIPSICRDPVIFLGNRSQGFVEALDKMIGALPNIVNLPEALFRIVGVDKKTDPNTGLQISKSESQHLSAQVDFLLTKPANKEQERILTRLEQTGSVLVQGPPGTGKSHTIANIIGHLLASGKTILVSSHTSKALRVVREKVVEPLQPLCVSVLENDMESKSQLEVSINGIVSYLSRTDLQSLTKEIDQLSQRRAQITSQIEKLETKALKIRTSEYTDILVAGEGTPPSEAARKVSEMESNHGWIPNPMINGAPLPLSEVELQELYSTNKILSVEDENCLAEGLPKFDENLKPSVLREMAANLKKVDPDEANRFLDLWTSSNQDLQSLDRLLAELSKALDIFSTNKWIQKVVEDSTLGKERLQPWFKLMDLIKSTTEHVAIRSEIILKHGPQVKIEPSPESIFICQEIVTHLQSGKSFHFLNMVFKKSWKDFIATCIVDDGIPSKVEHFQAILATLESKQLRKELIRRWERQVVAIGGPALDSNEPEMYARSLVDTLKFASNWTSATWKSIEDDLAQQGFNLKLAIERISIAGQATGFIEQTQLMIEKTLISAIDSRRQWIRLKELESFRENTLHTLRLSSQKKANSEAYLRQLSESYESLNIESYEYAYNKYLDIKGKEDVYLKRISLIKKLQASAEGWSKAIELRTGIHSSAETPGNPNIAWQICQWRQELDRRISYDYSSVQRDIQRLKLELHGINAQYVEKLAWRFQHSRTGLHEKQALTGWQQLQSKITKSGKGVRDVQIKREARKTLKDCKNAVPVWIMPLSRVFDSFDLTHTKFDVVILDEASQSDIKALVAFSIAKQVIVVGDSEQVTPHAVGQELGGIQSLIDELLQGIPNRMLYDGRTSVYDLAEQAFGETIRLVEHFRCTPDIIEFSNRLSYNGEIRPLREASSSPYQNHLIAHRISGATSYDKTNQKEALEVASIVASMIEMEEYKNASIGIISMVGQEQAVLIDSILQRKISASEYSRHSLLCGNASQFQGDERDVMLISLVDTCETPPLSIRQTDDFKKTFNVATSRARNQLWVIHSLNPTTDLKPGDLRLRLIQHAENPKALGTAIEAAKKKADPKSVVFEPMVIQDLMQYGFRVKPQFEVGAYTIDMVIEGSKKRIAIECDGDRYHPSEKLADDIQRQMVLERLKWTFIRIRGSEYFRNREATMKRVVSELEAMGIEKLGPANSHTAAEQNDNLRLKVLQRAIEIRKEWESNPELEQEEKPKQGRRGKKQAPLQEVRPIFQGNAAIKVDLAPIENAPAISVKIDVA